MPSIAPKDSMSHLFWSYSAMGCRCLQITILTHWGQATHICAGKLATIGSDNGLSPGRRQAIIWTSAGILLIRPIGTNFNEILTEILLFSFKKMRLKVSSAKRWPFCLGINVLNQSGNHANKYPACNYWNHFRSSCHGLSRREMSRITGVKTPIPCSRYQQSYPGITKASVEECYMKRYRFLSTSRFHVELIDRTQAGPMLAPWTLLSGYTFTINGTTSHQH